MQTTWLERGTVSGRVALLLRSAEIQPLFIDLSDWIHTSNPPLHTSNGRLQLQGGLPRLQRPQGDAVSSTRSCQRPSGLDATICFNQEAKGQESCQLPLFANCRLLPIELIG